MERQTEERPAVLDDLTTTQMAELQRQFDDGDCDSFNAQIESYGLDCGPGHEVWARFARDGTACLAGLVRSKEHAHGPAAAPATLANMLTSISEDYSSTFTPFLPANCRT